MPKVVSSQELENITLAIGRHAEGIGSDDLLRALGKGMVKRSLQRRLASLLDQGRIRATGEGRATRYHPLLPVPSPMATSYVAMEPEPGQIGGEAQIRLSAEGEEIRAYVHRPRQARTPVGYRMAFLESYHPNYSVYLPESLRAQLHQMGRSPVAEAPAGTFARDILNRLLIDLSWASSRLEGNTYSRLDTERLIEFGQAAQGKDALETQMILNHKAAIEYLVSPSVTLKQDTLIALHALLSDGLMADPLSCGRLRQRPVDIGGSVYLPLGLPQQLAELFGHVLDMAAEITDPFEQAFFLMVHLPYLQPFEDVNKRVSRLAANIPLMHHNLCPLSFVDVPQQSYVDGVLGVYELNRVELLRDVFVWAYERSCQQYVAVKQHLVPPDTFRLRYRSQLSAIVSSIVRADVGSDEASVRARLPSTVAETDREHFVTLVRQEFRHLHAGNAIRFGLSPLEFESWQTRHPG